MMSRMRATLSMPASSVIVGGSMARIHMLPSSSFGRNSVPSRAPSTPQSSEEHERDGRRDPVVAHGERQQDARRPCGSAAPRRSRPPDPLRQQDRGQHRRHREGRDHGAEQRIGIGARHRAENLAFDALHGEQRQERRDGDDDREQDRLVDLDRADQHAVELGRLSACRRSRRWRSADAPDGGRCSPP